MTFMVCPICREKVDGGGIDDLSQSLRAHLRGQHRMTSLPPPDEGAVLRPVYDAHDRDSVGTRWARPGEGYALVPEREEVTDFAVRCPFCLATVTGRSENDLGERVREHWSDDHGFLPRSRYAMPPAWGGRRSQ